MLVYFVHLVTISRPNALVFINYIIMTNALISVTNNYGNSLALDRSKPNFG